MSRNPSEALTLRSQMQNTVEGIPLAIALLLLFVVSSGCIHADATASFERLDGPTEVAESTTVDPDSLHPSVRTALSNGTSERTTEDSFLTGEFSDKDTVQYRGAYYRLSQREVGKVTAEGIRVNVTRTQRPAQYRLRELPNVDREPIERKIDSIRDSNPRIITEQLYELKERNRSVLLEEREIVVSHRGRNYTVAARDHETLERNLYVYESSVVANSSVEYSNRLLRNHSFTLEAPPESSESVLNEAIDDTYYGEETEGFSSLKDRFMQENPYILDDTRGVWFVRYNDSLYKAELRW
ncbi:hypothetical protein EGH25_09980 [Haladaptatus sp. F3-133]|uniref:Uncharacterized protein n=1 Tax=Halorutilus salinus TaxID=2487751 RepID=A0A9Q4C4F8_9EURY|nr:hypothetical protein [Halorutilus salinus]MCX2819675.1 hypothetical protein [Halorutilus salinus]